MEVAGVVKDSPSQPLCLGARTRRKIITIKTVGFRYRSSTLRSTQPTKLCVVRNHINAFCRAASTTCRWGRATSLHITLQNCTSRYFRKTPFVIYSNKKLVIARSKGSQTRSGKAISSFTFRVFIERTESFNGIYPPPL